MILRYFVCLRDNIQKWSELNSSVGSAAKKTGKLEDDKENDPNNHSDYHRSEMKSKINEIKNPKTNVSDIALTTLEDVASKCISTTRTILQQYLRNKKEVMTDEQLRLILYVTSISHKLVKSHELLNFLCEVSEVLEQLSDPSGNTNANIKSENINKFTLYIFQSFSQFIPIMSKNKSNNPLTSQHFKSFLALIRVCLSDIVIQRIAQVVTVSQLQQMMDFLLESFIECMYSKHPFDKALRRQLFQETTKILGENESHNHSKYFQTLTSRIKQPQSIDCMDSSELLAGSLSYYNARKEVTKSPSSILSPRFSLWLLELIENIVETGNGQPLDQHEHFTTFLQQFMTEKPIHDRDTFYGKMLAAIVITNDVNLSALLQYATTKAFREAIRDEDSFDISYRMIFILIRTETVEGSDDSLLLVLSSLYEALSGHLIGQYDAEKRRDQATTTNSQSTSRYSSILIRNIRNSLNISLSNVMRLKSKDGSSDSNAHTDRSFAMILRNLGEILSMISKDGIAELLGLSNVLAIFKFCCNIFGNVPSKFFVSFPTMESLYCQLARFILLITNRYPNEPSRDIVLSFLQLANFLTAHMASLSSDQLVLQSATLESFLIAIIQTAESTNDYAITDERAKFSQLWLRAVDMMGTIYSSKSISASSAAALKSLSTVSLKYLMHLINRRIMFLRDTLSNQTQRSSIIDLWQSHVSVLIDDEAAVLGQNELIVLRLLVDSNDRRSPYSKDKSESKDVDIWLLIQRIHHNMAELMMPAIVPTDDSGERNDSPDSASRATVLSQLKESFVSIQDYCDLVGRRITADGTRILKASEDINIALSLYSCCDYFERLFHLLELHGCIYQSFILLKHLRPLLKRTYEEWGPSSDISRNVPINEATVLAICLNRLQCSYEDLMTIFLSRMITSNISMTLSSLNDRIQVDNIEEIIDDEMTSQGNPSCLFQSTIKLTYRLNQISYELIKDPDHQSSQSKYPAIEEGLESLFLQISQQRQPNDYIDAHIRSTATSNSREIALAWLCIGIAKVLEYFHGKRAAAHKWSRRALSLLSKGNQKEDPNLSISRHSVSSSSDHKSAGLSTILPRMEALLLSSDIYEQVGNIETAVSLLADALALAQSHPSAIMTRIYNLHSLRIWKSIDSSKYKDIKALSPSDMANVISTLRNTDDLWYPFVEAACDVLITVLIAQHDGCIRSIGSGDDATTVSALLNFRHLNKMWHIVDIGASSRSNRAFGDVLRIPACLGIHSKSILDQYINTLRGMSPTCRYNISNSLQSDSHEGLQALHTLQQDSISVSLVRTMRRILSHRLDTTSFHSFVLNSSSCSPSMEYLSWSGNSTASISLDTFQANGSSSFYSSSRIVSEDKASQMPPDGFKAMSALADDGSKAHPVTGSDIPSPYHCMQMAKELLHNACINDAKSMELLRQFLHQQLLQHNEDVCSIAVLPCRTILAISRYFSVIDQAVVIHLQVNEELEDVLEEYDMIMKENDRLLSATYDEGTVGKMTEKAKKEWWNQRQENDKAMQEFLIRLENMLGGWKFLLYGSIDDTKRGNLFDVSSMLHISRTDEDSSIDQSFDKLSINVSEIRGKGVSSKGKRSNMVSQKANPGDKAIKGDDIDRILSNLSPWLHLIVKLQYIAEDDLSTCLEELILSKSSALSKSTAKELSNKIKSTILAKNDQSSDRPRDRTKADTCPDSLDASSQSYQAEAIDIPMNELNEMKVAELKSLLKSLSLSTAGKKSDLIERLQSHKESPVTSHQTGNRGANTIPMTSKQFQPRLIFIFDEHLQKLPWESIPCLSVSQGACTQQLYSRIPSFVLFLTMLLTRKLSSEDKGDCIQRMTSNGIDISKSWYLIDPESNLKSSRQTIHDFLSPYINQWNWPGFVSEAASADHLRTLHNNSECFIFCGHGSGAKYMETHRQRKHHMPSALLWGCSSGKLNHRGVHDPYGTVHDYLLGGAKLVVGNLWDVTDKDLDKFSMSCMSLSLPLNEEEDKDDVGYAVQKSRDVCKLKFIVGCAPVIYGFTSKFVR